MNTSSLTFSTNPFFKSSPPDKAVRLRNHFYEKFKRHIVLLLEQKKTRKVSARKGLLNPRTLYRHRFSDNVFQRTIRKESSDTTIIFLVDGSGSMNYRDPDAAEGCTRLEICAAVASAFAKANRTVLKNQIPIEVFIKSAPPVWSRSLTGTDHGSMVVLSRVFSSHSKGNDFDKLLRLDPQSPIVDNNGNYDGSYTSEFAVLPALHKWMKGNVRTKKCIVFNLTDGEAYCSLGQHHYNFRSGDNKAMRLKYLKGIPNLTLLLGGRSDPVQMGDVYGDNFISAETDFAGSLFKSFAQFLE